MRSLGSLWRASVLLCLLVASPAVSAPEASAPRKPYTRNVAIVLYEGVEVLDFAGPSEVFQAAGNIGAVGRERAFRVYTVARTRTPLTSQGFLKVVPEYTVDDAPKPDIIVVPGG